jgi:hypothetical protein
VIARAGARLVAAVAILLAPAMAVAQSVADCGARPAVAAAVDLTAANVRLDESVVPPSSEGDARLTHAVGVWGAGEVPLDARFALRVEIARSRFPIQPAPGATDAGAGDVSRSQFGGGLVVHPGGRRVCGHLALTAGWQRLSYAGVHASGLEIGGGVGVDMRTAERLFVFVEAGLAGAHNGSAPPVNAEIFFSARLLAGLRRTF